MNRYSRRVLVYNIFDLEPGDLIDISNNAMPYWSVVDHIGRCEDDDDFDPDMCDGDCRAVIFHRDQGDLGSWHIAGATTIYARFPADVDQAVIDAECEKHAAAAAARGRAREQG